MYPVLEEIIYVAKHKDEIEQAVPGLTVFCEDFETLLSFHDKLTFYKTMTELGIKTPKMVGITSKEQLREELEHHQSQKFILKPIFSRCALETRRHGALGSSDDYHERSGCRRKALRYYA